MVRREFKRLTDLEAFIMDAVWRLEQATVRDVQTDLKPKRPMAYNTVLTMMRILRTKGFLRSRREGRTDVYEATVTREQIAKSSLNEILNRFFSGSALALVSQLLDSEDLDPAEVQAIRREVNERLQGSV